MNKVYLKHGAEDVQGNRLNIRLEYILVAMGQTHSVISNGYHDIHVNNKYIKFKPRSNWSRFFCIKKNTATWEWNAVFLA